MPAPTAAEPRPDPAAVAASRFAQRPMLVFWETTRACHLTCRHCRAEAQRTPAPGELTTEQASQLMADVAAFGAPPPVIVFTGGDPLMRPDLFPLLRAARELGLHTAVSPAVGPLLTAHAMEKLAAHGVRALSISIDADEAAHDELRGVPGTFAASLQALRDARQAGLAVQVNTVVMRRTVAHLPAVAVAMLREGVRVWEVFFLVQTGRGLAEQALSPDEVGAVCRFLLEVTGHGLTVRTVEAPFIRAVQGTSEPAAPIPLYQDLRTRLDALVGSPGPAVPLARAGTLDGDGILFISHQGQIMPGGLLPLALGNVRRDSLTDVYRQHPVLQAIRARQFKGRCGACAWKWACGGSRARAFAASGDPLGSDPACPLVPA